MSHWPIASVPILTFTASPVIYEKKILVLMHHIDRANNDWKGQTEAFFMQKILSGQYFHLLHYLNPLYKKPSEFSKALWSIKVLAKCCLNI